MQTFRRPFFSLKPSPIMQVQKVNQDRRWQRKVHQDSEDRMASLDSLVHQVQDHVLSLKRIIHAGY